MLIAGLFAIVNHWKQPRFPSVIAWEKMSFILFLKMNRKKLDFEREASILNPIIVIKVLNMPVVFWNMKIQT